MPGRGVPVSSIPAEQLTHINYAFGHINEDGSAVRAHPSSDSVNFLALRDFKALHPHLRVLIALGGWGDSKYFSNAAATPESRTRFAQSVVAEFVTAFPGVFDGVDLDWEYPQGGGLAGNVSRPEDKENLTLLVQELRRVFDANVTNHMLITIAAPAGPGLMQRYELDKLADLLDFINVMTYDYHSGGKIAHFNSPLSATRNDPTPSYTVQETVAAYLKAGMPANKIVIGVPFYGYGFRVVSAADHGRLQARDTAATNDSTTADRKWVGSFRYKQLLNAQQEGFRRYWDAQAHVPWLFNEQTRTFITYDDVQSIGDKARFARERGLGGVMFWELSGDDGTLLRAIFENLIR